MPNLDETRAAAQKLADKVDEALRVLAECEAIATEFNLTFQIDLGNSCGGKFDAGEWTNSSANC